MRLKERCHSRRKILWPCAVLLFGLLAAHGFSGEAAPRAQKDTPATLQFELAQKLRSKKLLKTAIPEYRQFLAQHQNDPRYPDALFWLGQCYFDLKQYDRAVDSLGAFCRDFTDHKSYPWGLLTLGRSHLALDKHSRAADVLAKLCDLPPPDKITDDAVFYSGQAYYKAGDYEQAVAPLVKTVESATADARYRSLAMFWLARARQHMKEYKDAIAVYRRYLNEFPALSLAADVRMHLGQCYQQTGDYASAAKFFGAAANTPRFAPGALYNRAQSLFQLKKYADAIATAERLVEKFPDNDNVLNVLLLMGRGHFELKHYKQSAEVFEAVAERFPDAPVTKEAMRKVCSCYYPLGKQYHPARMKACRKFLAKYPDSKEANEVRFLLGDVCAAVGRLDSALKQFRAIPKQSPRYELSRYRIAITLHQLRDLPAAAEAYDALVAEFPKHNKADFAVNQAASIYFYLASVAKSPEDKDALFAKAEKRFEMFLERFPDHEKAPEMLFKKGQSEQLQGKTAEMAASFGKYVQLDEAPEAGTAWYWIGQRQQQKGDRLRLQAQNAAGQQAAARRCELLEQAFAAHDNAIAAYRKSIELTGPEIGNAHYRSAQSNYAAGSSRAALADILLARAKDLRDKDNPKQAETLEKTVAKLKRRSEEQLDTAAETFAMVFAKAPKLAGDHKTYRWTAARFRSRGKLERAAGIYKELLERWPKVDYRDGVLCQLGMIYAEMPKPDWNASLACYGKLLKEYDSMAEEQPARPRKYENRAKLGMGLALKNTGDPGRAAELFQQVIEDTPQGERINVSSTVELAECYYRQAQALEDKDEKGPALKKYAEALSLFVKVGMLYEDNDFTPRALFWSGRCTVARDNLDEATGLWRQLIEKYPDSPWTDKVRAELKKHGIVIE